MLLLAKIDQGKLHLDLAEYDLAALIAEAAGHAAPLVRRRKAEPPGHPLGRRRGRPSPVCECDRNLVLRVIDNILSNAIKFSPPGGRVEIGLHCLGGSEGVPGGRFRIEIEDEGTGIPEALREKIFEKFEIGQVKREVPQIGLGLAFCRTAIEAHGGTISVCEGRSGRGTRMIIDL